MMPRRLAPAVLFIAIASLSACGGGASNGVVPKAPVTPKAKLVNATFTMHWPASRPASRGRRSPKFISPSTKSVIVEVNNDPTLTVISNSPSTTGGTTTLNIMAPAGSDTFVVSLYDKAQAAGETTTVGNELGQVEFAQTITAGKANTLNATVDGIVASIGVAAAPNQGYVRSTGTASSPAFSIVGPNPMTLVLTPLDADGNAIVAPGNTPEVALVAAQSATGFSVLPVNGDTQRFVVQPTAPETDSPAFTASATDSLGDTVSMHFPISQIKEFFVSYPTTSGTKIVATGGDGKPVTLGSTAFSGLQSPDSMIYDPTFNHVLVGDSAAGTVVAFDTQGNAVSGFTPITLSGVTGVTLISYKNYIAAVNSTSGVIDLAQNGQSPGDTAIHSPFTVTTGTAITYVPPTQSGGDLLYIADSSGSTVDIFNDYGVQPIFGSTSLAVNPSGTIASMTSDASANVFAVGSSGRSGEIWQIPIDGSTGNAMSDANAPSAVDYDASLGELWILESGTNTVQAYTTSLSPDASHAIALPTNSVTPKGLTVAY